MTKAKTALAPTESEREIVRVTFRFHGAELGQIREVRDMLSLNSEVDAARYLMQRGLEAMTATLTSRWTQGQMTSKVNPEEIIKQMVAMGFGPGADPTEEQLEKLRAKKKR